MNNEDAIRKILNAMQYRKYWSMIHHNTLNYCIESIQENTKLKAEIEQLKKQRETRIKVSEANFNIYSKLEIERDNLVISVEQLKSELEQSVKEKSEVISKIEYALNECEPVYNKCAVIPQVKPIYDLAMNYCLDLMKGATND